MFEFICATSGFIVHIVHKTYMVFVMWFNPLVVIYDVNLYRICIVWC